MAPIKEFNPIEVRLRGQTLIQASAGTGKTYAIESLYLRLLLEEGHGVDRILVVTFTEAATADLKRRIREKLRRAVRAFETGRSDEEALLLQLRLTPDHPRARQILQTALCEFDRAAIHTIHAFCRRALLEQAFESGALFDTELITDQSDMLLDTVRDYWREAMYPLTPLGARAVLNERFSLQGLLSLARQLVGRPLLRILPERPAAPDRQELATREARLRRAFDALAQEWGRSRSAAIDLLKDAKLHQTSYKEPRVDSAALALDACLAAGDLLGESANIELFGNAKIGQSVTQKSPAAPVHALFDQCDRLLSARQEFGESLDRWILARRVGLRDFCDERLKARKQQRNVRYFDDLLLDLHAALSAAGGDGLAQRLRSAYPAALIDEFQDTDPLQYLIFRRIYADPKSALFLIGDPKQSIYHFRNADVFTYLEAAGKADDTRTLTRNWRSSEPLIQAVNALFSRARDLQIRPFVIEGIEYENVAPGRPAIGSEFRSRGEPDEAPMKLWLIRRNDDFTRVAAVRQRVGELVAAEISRLVAAGRSGELKVKDRPLTAGDVAVLVRTHDQAALVQQALQARGVPCVLHTRSSVLASEEAVDLARVLAAIADPVSESKVKIALATPLFARSGDQLAAEQADEPRWEERLQSFASWRDRWMAEGLMRVVRRWMSEEGVRGRLLAAPDGARRMTNLLHCLELLNQAVLQDRLGMEGALQWLAEGRAGREGVEAEERQLRLESDDDAVKVLTLHVSKGLEFPVVFCPFNWQPSPRSIASSCLAYHDPSSHFAPVRDLSPQPSQEAKELAEREGHAEDIRLLYVGVTRAQYRCTLVWGGFADAAGSALAHLLHPGKRLRFRQSSRDSAPATGDEELLADLRQLRDKSQGAIEIVEHSAAAGPPPPAAPGPPAPAEALACRRFTAAIRRDWGNTSYSALVSSHHRPAELPDRDDTSEAPARAGIPTPGPDSSFMDFPRGPLAGKVLHEILEQADFSNPGGEASRALVHRALLARGLDEAWQEAVLQMLAEISAVPLGTDGAAFTLAQLDPRDRIAELDFTLPLEGASAGRLREVFSRNLSKALPAELPRLLEKLEFMPVRGLLKGYIDAVVRWQDRYYLIDWKSNDLGSRPHDYLDARIRDTMAAEYYFLQYHLYTVALHRFLSARLGSAGYSYERNMGGSVYLFLRGVRRDWGAGSGLFVDRPDERLIQELESSILKPVEPRL